ncbi:MAG: virulence protein SciE type [Phycisphaerales bacterium]|nr:virulence protein SciE type [Phycisphaerales bacterium]
MNAETLVKEGKLDEALAALKQEVRAKAGDARLRVFLFQLQAVMGAWEGAMTQLNVAADLDAANSMMAQVCRPALQAEALRAEVFKGQRAPLVFGEPEPWIGPLVQAAMLFGQGKFEAGAALRDQAFDLAPARAGMINDERFEWLADADGRMGPVVEALIEGRYYWVPLTRVHELRVDAPTDLRDLIWTPATFRWTNGGESVALLFARYPGSESSRDPRVRLGRATEWAEREAGVVTGLGQRMLATDAGEYPMLEARLVRFEEASGG